MTPNIKLAKWPKTKFRLMSRQDKWMNCHHNNRNPFRNALKKEIHIFIIQTHFVFKFLVLTDQWPKSSSHHMRKGKEGSTPNMEAENTGCLAHLL